MTAKRKVGRQPKLTPRLRARILKRIRAGNYIEIAARSCGISPATFFEWMARGRGTDSRPSTPMYAEFAHAVVEAEAEAEASIVEAWAKLAKTDHAAGRDLLERRHAARWSKRVNVVVEDQLNAAIARLKSQLTPEEFERALRAIAAEPGREGAGVDPGGQGSGGSGASGLDRTLSSAAVAVVPEVDQAGES